MEQRSDSKSKRSDSKSPKMQRGGSSEFAKKEENSALAFHELSQNGRICILCSPVFAHMFCMESIANSLCNT